MQFKKCTTFILAILLLVSSSGLILNVHYCGEKIASVSMKLNQKPVDLEKNCCRIIEKKSSCCNDKIIKIQENSIKFQKEISNLKFSKICFINFNKPIVSKIVADFRIKNKNNLYNFKDHLPPIFKLNCQLVFYA
jgi:hypothetical protein